MNYLEYQFTKKELIAYVCMGVVGLMVISKLFYGTFLLTVLMLPLLIPFMKIQRSRLNEKRRKKLKMQFKDAMLSISDLMNVGYSIENAIKECYREMAMVHGRDSYICKELINMTRKIELNTPVETLFADFAGRTDVDEIVLFSQVFTVAKRMGGDMVLLIHMVADNISQSFNVEEEINVVISEKKMEQKMMTFVPFGIIIYVSVTSPGFLDVMYETFAGRIIMTVCLAAYGLAYWMAEKIVNIEMG